MALAFIKYNCFVENLAEKVHNLGADALKIALSNTAPNVATNTVLADITEISAGNGYSAGGVAITTSSSSQSAGLYKLVLADATLTASGGSIEPFRYLILYNSTAADGPLIGYWDRGSSLTLAATESETFDFDPTTGALQLT